MNGREWKPGDVALALWCADEEPIIHLRVKGGDVGGMCKNHTLDDHWHSTRRTWTDSLDNAEWSRPLVVIDPEDREQVERLYQAYYANKPEDQPVLHLVDQMQAALREFADPTPPKPDEPQGLGAVIEDAAGTTWVRASRNDPEWRTAGGHWKAWDEIAVAKVLAEGWSE